MSRSTVIGFGVIPALITIPLTALRAWLEVHHPGAMIAKLVSVNVLAIIWMICIAAQLRRSGARIGAYLAVLAAFAAIYRVVIGAVYALAWAQEWKTPGGTLTRYQLDVIDALRQLKIDPSAPVSAALVFALTTFLPIVTQIVAGTLIWFIVRLGVKPRGPSPTPA